MALVLGTATLSMMAFLLTQARCGAIAGPLLSTSTYCRAVGAPGVGADTFGSILIVALFVSPALVASAGAAVSLVRPGAHGLRWSAVLALAVVATSFILLSFAHASYAAD